MGAYKSTGVSPEREGDRKGRVPKCPPAQKKLLKTRDLELPFFLRDLSQVVRPHSVGYTRTSLHPYFPVAN